MRRGRRRSQRSCGTSRRSSSPARSSAGRAGSGIGQDGREHGFQISQRADYFEVEVGLETTLKRPIINTRDEPHADPEKYRRLHVIIGDANLAEISTYLKVGTTALVLAMIEDGFLDDLDLMPPRPGRRAARGVPRPDAAPRGELRDGRQLTAVQLQMEYLEQVAQVRRGPLRRRRRRRRPSTCSPAGSRCSPGSRPTRCAVPRARLGRQARAARGLPRPRRPRLGRRTAAPGRPAVLRRPPRQGPVPPAGRARPDRAAARRRRSRAAVHAPPRGHPRLLPWRVPAPVRRRRRRGVLGLGDLRRPRARLAAAGADARPAARDQAHVGAAAGPLPDRGRPRRGPDVVLNRPRHGHCP